MYTFQLSISTKLSGAKQWAQRRPGRLCGQIGQIGWARARRVKHTSREAHATRSTRFERVHRGKAKHLYWPGTVGTNMSHITAIHNKIEQVFSKRDTANESST